MLLAVCSKTHRTDMSHHENDKPALTSRATDRANVDGENAKFLVVTPNFKYHNSDFAFKFTPVTWFGRRSETAKLK